MTTSWWLRSFEWLTAGKSIVEKLATRRYQPTELSDSAWAVVGVQYAQFQGWWKGADCEGSVSRPPVAVQQEDVRYGCIFIVSLFRPDVRIYEQNNNGGWYDFGFMIGISSAFGSGGTAVTTGT